RHGGDDVESLALEEAVGLHLEGDQQVARRTARAPFAPLSLEADLGARVGAGGDGDEHLLARPHLADAVAGRAALGGHLASSEAHRAGTVHGEAALAEGDDPAPLTLGAGLDRRARRRAVAVAGGALLVHFE